MSQDMPYTSHAARHRPRTCLVLALLAVATTLAGCGIDRTVTGSIVEDDLRARHPIVLANSATSLDIFPSSARLDIIASRQLREFAQDYRQHGEGQITVMLPQGGSQAAIAHQSLDAIRHELTAGGATGYISVGSYPIADPSLAAPVRLSFSQLKAKTATRCGEWPADLAGGSTVESWNNRPFYNLGCAYQSNLAAQIDNPRDLASPRAEQPTDTASRTRAIQAVRKGNDPTTSWKTQNSRISPVGN